MARTPNPINYLQVVQAIPTTDPLTYVTTLTITYVVGNKDAQGKITLYSHPAFQGAANGVQLQVAAQPTDTHQQTYLAVQTALALKEGLILNGATPDTIILP